MSPSEVTTRRPRTSRRRALLALLVVSTILSTTGCILGVRVGQRCRTTDFGSAGDWVLQCRNGRWARFVTTQQVAQLVVALSAPQPVGPPLRIIVGGDSTGTVMANALTRYANRHPGLIEVVDVSMLGCPVTLAGSIRNFDGEAGQDTDRCGLWTINVPAKVEEFHPEVAIVYESMMEQADQRVGPADPWRNVLDPEWAAHQRTDYHRYVDELTKSGAHVFWADVPFMQFWLRTVPWIADQPERTVALNASYRQFVSERTDTELLPIADHFDLPFGAIDRRARPDGIHLTEPASDAEADRLVRMLYDRYRKAP